MRKYPFDVGGETFHLRELDLDAKTDIADRVTAVRLAQCDRLFKKKLRTADQYLTDSQAAFVSWGGKGLAHGVKEDPEMQKAWVRVLLVETVDDATFDRILKSPGLEQAVKRVNADDNPGAGDPDDPKAGPPA